MLEHDVTQRLDAVPPAHDADAPIPEYLLQWDRYAIKRRLGSGGMGEVFEAWDPQLGRFVALKFLGWSDVETLERFEREARAQAHVDHPAICKVFEVGEVAGRRYIAMQKIDGVTLDRIAPRLPLDEKVSLVRELAEAMHAAHRRGLIHRDLKPGNILIEEHEDGTHRPFIVDFGLARDQENPSATIAGTIYGTMGYMSPEQARGRPDEVDRRTDIYNLGIILYELIAERPAFEFDSMLNSLARLQTEDVIPPRRFNREVPVDLETVVLKAMERDPDRRYPSAHAFAEDLRRFQEGEPIVARRSSIVYRVRMKIRKHRVVASVIAAALVLLAVAGGWALRERWRADARAEIAQRFGMEMTEIDLLTRVAGMLPPERVVPLRTLVLPRMERIRREIRRSGKLAEGPGSYALARGSIVLGDYRGAWDLLEQARRVRYDTPDVHYARGQVLGHFYDEALTRAGAISDAELRKAARAEAVRLYRTPSIDELHRAQNGSVAPPELLRAQIALREERFDDAIQAARRSIAAAPWLYESVVVEVTAMRAQANALADAGRIAEALTTFATAQRQLDGATVIARGDATVYNAGCGLQYDTLVQLRFQRRLTTADVAAAIAPCDTAARLDRTMAAPWATRGMMHGVIAEDQLRHGEDPSEQVAESERALRTAIKLDAKDTAALAGFGRAQMLQARWGIPHGVDPRPRLDAGREALLKAIAIDPQASGYRVSLANALITRAEYEQRIGNDSRPWLLQAIEQGRRAAETTPNVFTVHNVLGNTYNTLADREVAHGGDPRAALAEAAKAFERAVALNPSNSPILNNQGNTSLTLAEYLTGRGEPMEAAAAAAIASYRRAIEVRPDYNIAWINIGYANRLIALDRVRRRIDPTPALREAREALDRYDAANKDDVDSAVERARTAIIEARWLLASAKDPRAALDEATRLSRRALEIDKESVPAMLALAESKRWEAEYKSTPATLAAAREAIERVKETPDGQALEAAVLSIDARTRYPESAELLRRQANELLAKALQAKPSLRRDYE